MWACHYAGCATEENNYTSQVHTRFILHLHLGVDGRVQQLREISTCWCLAGLVQKHAFVIFEHNCFIE